MSRTDLAVSFLVSFLVSFSVIQCHSSLHLF